MPSSDLGAVYVSDKCGSVVCSHVCQALFLEGAPVIRLLASWCIRNSKSIDGIKPTLAVVFFNTGVDADEYLRIKAEVAAKAGIDFIPYELAPNASTDRVLNLISALNKCPQTHGILVQRPLPIQISEADVMGSISRQKHIEECVQGDSSNIAVDGVVRLLASYRKADMLDLSIVLLGGTNIITPGFKAELKNRYPRIEMFKTPEEAKLVNRDGVVVMTELNKGGIIQPEMLGPGVELVIDLGFDINTKMGDLDPRVFDVDGLMVVPTPGGTQGIKIHLASQGMCADLELM
ncbi:Bifunctional protein FolD [Colletotrichum gloeosporioides]|uniref:Bifunctional protein FolD n=1 Tax=Colletotrichum gloeosporioides TaxID=474922 RepID=A0A8H4C5I4_COLGL|nr:Bifunctional protein FolD [Colletotrichum gloeosporioides]KAF3797647.1 Bifunctional protein FolD [Colletotrichum gloeosporioides]